MQVVSESRERRERSYLCSPHSPSWYTITWPDQAESNKRSGSQQMAHSSPNGIDVLVSLRCCCSHLGSIVAAIEGSQGRRKVSVLVSGNRLGPTLWKCVQQSSKALMCSTEPSQHRNSARIASLLPVSTHLFFILLHQKSQEKQLTHKDKASINIILYLGKRAQETRGRPTSRWKLEEN